jgi:hypothetical protein
VIAWGEQIGEDLVAIDARGVLQIQDGTSNTVLISERTGSTATCAQTQDEFGRIKVQFNELSLHAREPRSKAAESVIVRIVHTAEAQPGTHIAKISIDDRTFEGTMQVRSLGWQTMDHPGQGDRRNAGPR